MDAPGTPSGTLAFLFTDIEGSTHRWEHHQQSMGATIARHDAMLRHEIEVRDGYVFKTVGDAFCAAFHTVPLAVAAAIAAQRCIEAEDWGEPGPVRVRMAVHVGAAEEREGDYFGPSVNRVARLLSAGHGGQVLLSLPAAELARDSLPEGISLRDMGEHRLKDLARPERIFQIVVPGLAAVFAPLRTLDNRPNNLPQQVTPFVGRERDVAAIAGLLREDHVRLVTLTGPGGTGKTRLSLQVAAELLDDYPDGVWFVPLEAATDEERVSAAIAQALAVRERAGSSLEEAVLEFVASRTLLLVLDNFEQVAHAAPLVSRLLRAGEGLDVLVSSRVRLGIQGDHEYRVPPLGLPDLADGGTVEVEQLAQCEAVQLFVDRAQAAKRGFELTQDNAAAVAQICQHIDGLPLAIELAAARVRMLPPPALLARLSDTLRMLVGGGADRPERHQTLRGTIGWSYDLLLPSQQVLLARLSVFAGGWTFDAAEAVANPNGDLDVFTDLEALVDHSMVRQEEMPDGEPRFHALVTIRDFAREQLATMGTNEVSRVRSGHADWSVELAESAEPELTGPDQAAWLSRLDDEIDNLRAALGWLEETGKTEAGLRLAGALWRFWWGRGYLSEGYGWLTRLLARADSVDTAVRAKALDAAGTLLADQGDLAAATHLHEDALAIYRTLGDARGMAWVSHNIGIVARMQGQEDTAEAVFEESLALMRSAGDEHGTSRVLNSLGALAFGRGSYDRATALYEESLAIGRRLRDEQHVLIALANLAEAREYQGDLERASALYEDALVARGRSGTGGRPPFPSSGSAASP